MTEKIRLSYSKANVVLRCGQEYIWKYEEGLSPIGKSYPLRLGSITHTLLHGYDKNEIDLEFIQDYEKVFELAKKEFPEEENDDLLKLTDQASGLCSGYIDEHKDSDIKIIPGETMLELETENYTLVGYIDGWARPSDGKLFRLERKTTAKIDNYYLNGLRGGLQGAIYDFMTEKLFKEKLHGTIYDMLVKTKEPKFPRQFTKCDRTSIALMQQCLEGVVRDIHSRNLYPNPGSCFRYNSECPYRVLCTYDSPGARENFFTKRKEENGNHAAKPQNAGEQAVASD